MRKIREIRYVSMSLVVVLIFISGCSQAKDKSKIYTKGKEWKFEATFVDENNVITDSCSITMTVTKPHYISILTSQIPIVYKYQFGARKYDEKTGVEEDADGVFIHPPRMGKFSFLQVPPMPTVSYPLTATRIKSIELNTLKSEYKPASGKIIKQELKQNNVMDTLVINGKRIPCLKITGQNIDHIDEIGLFRVEYWFSSIYGFVKMHYIKPDNSGLQIILTATNF